MRKIFRAALLGAALVIGNSSPVLAVESDPQRQPSDATDETEIVVTATAKEQIADFVDDLTVRPAQGQLARFEDSVCPAVAGVAAEQKVAIVARMRAVAAAAGLEVAPADCRANILLLIADDKKAMLQEFGKRFPGASRDVSGREWRALLNSKAPAVAWHLNGAPINADGHEVQERSEDFYVNRTGRSGSHITQQARPQFAAAVVVVESAALAGLTTTQLADYASMRALLNTEPEKMSGSKISTILTILDAAADAEVPMTLTQWDLEALRGFYSANRNVSVAAQRSEMREQIMDQVAQKDIGGN